MLGFTSIVETITGLEALETRLLMASCQVFSSSFITSHSEKVEPSETIDSDLEYIPTETASTNNTPTVAANSSSGDNYGSKYSGGSKTYTIDESVHGDGYSYGVELRGVTYKKYRQGIGSGSYWNKPYGSHNYASSGCGPISSAILASGYGVEEGPTYYGNLYHGSPPSFSGIKKALASVGIEGESYTISHSDSAEMTSSALALAKRMQEALEEGKPVIVLVGHSSKVGEAYQYTSKGHYFVFIGIDDDGTPIYCNTTSDTHEYTHRGSFRRENPIEEFVFYYMQNSGSSNRGIFIPNEPPSGIKKDDPYTGYQGNEGVVSPVTGVLLEYGTYSNSDKDSITDEQYRVNVDLKYGPIASIITESADEEKTEFKSQIVSDKVGYAKILVLDNENYQKIEQALVGKTSSEFKRELDGELGGSFLAEDGKYQDFSSLADKDRKKVLETINKKWNDYDKTLYGYKEFAELYDKYGISGYIIFIDGFVCELPDEDLKGDKKIAEKLPEGEKLTLDSFKAVTPENLDLSQKKEQLATSYKADTKYKLASQKATTKLYAETKIKTLASTSMYTDDIILLKEGTIIGRTMTDAELLKNDEIRDRSEYRVTYEEARPSDVTQKGEVIGNYIRVIMRDLDGTPVENVEDYMKLATKGGIQISDDYDVSDPDYFVTLDQFLIMFANYPNIIANAEAFIEMQDKYQVNAVFAAAVTITESGGGTGWDLIDPSTYNWFSIKGTHGGGYIDRNGTSWNRYSSFAEAVDSFGNLIANSSHYYKADKYWVSQIGPTYCSESWVKSTIKHMNEAYEKIL